ncbi:hypothetical protein AGDE_14925 [Angomonas deanei]|nr:hypothetical protein AGDE_14925 [Angomonas deanei]|eukprot:EPY19988.1 hypothetical protein AGDE_14925 [Angomonas deanei]
MTRSASVLRHLLEHYVSEEGAQLVEGLVKEHPHLPQVAPLTPSVLRWYLAQLTMLDPRSPPSTNVQYWKWRYGETPPRQEDSSPLILDELRLFLPYCPVTRAMVEKTPLTGMDQSRLQQVQALERDGALTNSGSHTREDIVRCLTAAEDDVELAKSLLSPTPSLPRHRYSSPPSSYRTSATITTTSTARNTVTVTSSGHQFSSATDTTFSHGSRSVDPADELHLLECISWFKKAEVAIQQRQVGPEHVLHVIKEIEADPSAVAYLWYTSEGGVMKALKVLLKCVM